MDKFQAAFEILYIASGIDGVVDEKELEIILRFIKSNEKNLDFDPIEISEDIDLLNRDGVIEEFIKVSNLYNDLSSAKEKRILIDFLLELIAADGDIDEDEIVLLMILSKNLNIDLDKYLK